MIHRHGEGDVDADAVLSAIAIGPERTMDADVAFGLQTLVDIAERSMADSFMDPTTASQVVDRIHDCLRLLATRDVDTGRHEDRNGDLRLVVPTYDWDDYVSIAFDPLIRAGADSPQVAERMESALLDLRAFVPPGRRRALDARLDELRRERPAARSA